MASPGLPFLIAEIGFNHGGDVPLAMEMITQAAKSGADAVKFQTFRAKDILHPTSEYFPTLNAAEFDLSLHQDLADHARAAGVEFMSTPFSQWALDILEKTDVQRYKIASMDCVHLPLLKAAAQTGKPLIVSTGMATLDEVKETHAFLVDNGCTDLTFLHCQSLYPAKAEQLDLSCITTLKRELPCKIGYSDHYPGIDACVVAALLGAEVIETHFTTDTSLEGGDHGHSADPETMAMLRARLDLHRSMLGTGDLTTTRLDREFASVYRRGVYAARDIKSGTEVSQDDVLFCRPPTELNPNKFTGGRAFIAKSDIESLTLIQPEDLSESSPS